MGKSIVVCVAMGAALSGCSLFPTAHWSDDFGRRCVERCDRKADAAIQEYCSPTDTGCTVKYNVDRRSCWEECPGVTVK